jgi:hypothetical protein
MNDPVTTSPLLSTYVEEGCQWHLVEYRFTESLVGLPSDVSGGCSRCLALFLYML